MFSSGIFEELAGAVLMRITVSQEIHDFTHFRRHSQVHNEFTAKHIEMKHTEGVI